MSINSSLRPQKYFSVDYRSCPSGIGTIVDSDGDILVTSPDSGPKSIEESLNMFGDLYKFVIYIDKNFGEDYESAHKDLRKVLTKSQVPYVYDSELAIDCPDINQDGFFKTNDWLETVSQLN